MGRGRTVGRRGWGVSWFDALMQSVFYRGFMGVAGLLVIATGVLVLTLLVRRLVTSRRDIGAARRELRAIADSGHWGEIPRAAAEQRSVVPFALALFSGGVPMLLICFLGPRFEKEYLHWSVLAIAFSGALVVVARELGMPWFLVPPESRGVPGLLAWRLQQRRAERLAEKRSER